MSVIGRKSVPVNLIVYFPKTEEGRRESAHRAADVHADTVNCFIQKLKCPAEQKLKLLNAVIADAKKRADK